MDYKRARAIIRKYALPEDMQAEMRKVHPTPAPKLADEGSFYSDVRRR